MKTHSRITSLDALSDGQQLSHAGEPPVLLLTLWLEEVGTGAVDAGDEDSRGEEVPLLTAVELDEEGEDGDGREDEDARSEVR
jgi:hypothetical protein